MIELKEPQRRSLAILIISLIGFIYLDRILIPYLAPKDTSRPQQATNSSPTTSTPEESTGLNKTNPTITTSATKSNPTTDNTKKLDYEKIIASGTIEINTGVTKVKISNLGGRISSLELSKFKKEPDSDNFVNNIFSDSNLELPAGIKWSNGDDSQIVYSSNNKTSYELSESENSQEIKLIGTLPTGGEIEKTFVFFKDSYLFKVFAKIKDPALTQPISFEWTKKVLSNEDTSILDPYDSKGFVWFNGEDSHRLTFTEMSAEKATTEILSPLWLGVGDKYFATAIIGEPKMNSSNVLTPTPGASGSKVTKDTSGGRMIYVSSSNNEVSVQVFSGPKSYSILEDLGYELRRLLDLGKSGLISAPLLSLLNVFYKLVNNYGLAIVLLTIMVKLVLYPLNSSQFKQMKALSALKPEMDKIKETITDKQLQQAAMMELYKKKGVNPLGGCLPVLVQMPVFIGLYSALMLAVELRHADFGMWVHDLSVADRLMVGGVGIPMLVVLFTASMMVQQYITPSTMDPAQKKVMMFMPLVMFFMFVSFPAGLALYWLTNNLIGIGQQQSLMYSEKSGKSGFKITALVALLVYGIAYLFTKF